MKVGILLVAALLLFSGVAYADLSALNEKAQSEAYLEKTWAMLFRGVTHVILSPGELVYGVYHHTVNGKPFIGTVNGLGWGTHHLLDRGGRGVLDIATFWTPGFNGYPASTDFPMSS